MKFQTVRLDHVVYIGSDLHGTAAYFKERTGVEPIFGGVHRTGGTANFIAGLDGGRYIELLGPDPGQQQYVAQGPYDWLSICRGADRPEIHTFCMAYDDLDDLAGRFAKLGIPVVGPQEFRRVRSDGVVLRWRLLFCAERVFGSRFPFFIDWGISPHPSESAVSGCILESLAFSHPQAGQVERILRAIGAPMSVHAAPLSDIRMSLLTPKGQVEL